MVASRAGSPTDAEGAEDLAPRLPLQRAASIDEYVADPIGRYVAGPTFVVHWCSPNVNGISFWGRPDEEHLRTVTRGLDAVLLPGRPHHRVLIDARSLSGVDWDAFAHIASYMVKHRATHARLCTRQALVRPEGLPGAVVAGFYALVDPGYPVNVFDDAKAALDWLGIPRGDELLRELVRIRADLADSAQLLLSELRALLDRHPKVMTIHAAAEALAVSQRTLQRRLTDAGSSFRAELAAAHVRLAKELLGQRYLSVKQVAARVGYSSVSQFVSSFRRMTGHTPASWATASSSIDDRRRDRTSGS